MGNQFKQHYTREEARALLPEVKQWLGKLAGLRAEVETCEERMTGMIVPGRDIGGSLVNSWVRKLVAMQDVLMEFFRREIQVKDLDRGLIDFPAFHGDKEVFLCWEQGEEDIEFWHDLDSGYAGRERL